MAKGPIKYAQRGIFVYTARSPVISANLAAAAFLSPAIFIMMLSSNRFVFRSLAVSYTSLFQPHKSTPESDKSDVLPYAQRGSGTVDEGRQEGLGQ
jgi:hypothetical protein